MLECWNDGIMGPGKMGQWFIGKIPLDKDINKRVTSFKNQHSIIPPFHYSMYEAEAQASKKSLYSQ